MQVNDMVSAGITDDFTLSYPDKVGFRTGTCHSYHFINPVTCEVTPLIIHPLQIMECTLGIGYMGVDESNAFELCKNIIDTTFKNNGDLNLLWHNTSFNNQTYYERLYIKIIEYIKGLYSNKSKE